MSKNNNHLRWSRFAKFIDGGNGYTGILNSLNLAVVVVKTDFLSVMEDFLECRHSLSGENEGLINELRKQRILLSDGEFEENDLNVLKEHLKYSPVGIMYLILCEPCNISCRYCFFEKEMIKNVPHKTFMDKELVKKGIDFFTDVVVNSLKKGLNKPQIIIYGGEPFQNWSVMFFTLEYVNTLISGGKLPANTSVVINSNGTLISDEVARELSEFPFITVAISIDGDKSIHDLQRVDRFGNGTFDKTHRGIIFLKNYGVDIGFSCTLANHNIDKAEEVLVWLFKTYEVNSIGLNILIGKLDDEEYADKVANKLIACFSIARSYGIYEDRTMRKVKTFIDGSINFYDCGACGQQIVLTPDGQVGVCQGYCGTRKYFTSFSKNLNLSQHPYWMEWRRRSPINMPQCVDCVALGSCGGGCPFNAEKNGGSIWTLDKSFCVYSKKFITFLVKDLIGKITSSMTSL